MFGSLWSDVFGNCMNAFSACKDWWLKTDNIDWYETKLMSIWKYDRNYIHKKAKYISKILSKVSIVW